MSRAGRAGAGFYKPPCLGRPTWTKTDTGGQLLCESPFPTPRTRGRGDAGPGWGESRGPSTPSRRGEVREEERRVSQGGREGLSWLRVAVRAPPPTDDRRTPAHSGAGAGRPGAAGGAGGRTDAQTPCCGLTLTLTLTPPPHVKDRHRGRDRRTCQPQSRGEGAGQRRDGGRREEDAGGGPAPEAGSPPQTTATPGGKMPQP